MKINNLKEHANVLELLLKESQPFLFTDIQGTRVNQNDHDIWKLSIRNIYAPDNQLAD